jgi:hypothetical protein
MDNRPSASDLPVARGQKSIRPSILGSTHCAIGHSLGRPAEELASLEALPSEARQIEWFAQGTSNVGGGGSDGKEVRHSGHLDGFDSNGTSRQRVGRDEKRHTWSQRQNATPMQQKPSGNDRCGKGVHAQLRNSGGYGLGNRRAIVATLKTKALRGSDCHVRYARPPSPAVMRRAIRSGGADRNLPTPRVPG